MLRLTLLRSARFGVALLLSVTIIHVAHGHPDRAAMVAGREQKQSDLKWWDRMDYGPFLTGVLHVRSTKADALKAICIELGDEGNNMTFAFDTDLLRGAALFEGRTVRNGTPYNGSHGGTLETRGTEWLATAAVPGWSHAGSFADPRPIPHGRIPSEWAKYQGLHRHGDKITLTYSVGTSSVLDHPSLVMVGSQTIFLRDLNISARTEELLLNLSDVTDELSVAENGLTATIGARHLRVHSDCNARFAQRIGRLVVVFPAGSACRARVAVSTEAIAQSFDNTVDLRPLLSAGPALYPQTITLAGERAADDAPYVVDDIPVPFENPWASKMRMGAFDFFSDGTTAAVCTWNGDVWIVSGIDEHLKEVTWKRYATGLFEPLGLKIVDDKVYVHGRDQLTRLHDDNDDGEADRYECFNNDVMTTRNFHEFCFDLKTDQDGNFYFSKGGPVKAGGRGFDTIVPHNGTVMKVSADGSSLEVVATGLRAPNGIGVGPNGELTSGDNEGTSVPHGRINWFRTAKFASVPDTAHGEPCDQVTPPLCWLPMEMDNSNGDQVWVEDDRWGPFKGDMLHLSYGTCFLMKVMRQDLADTDVVQGGVFRIPVNFASGIMRSRFNQRDGQLYVSGLRGWQTTAARLSAFQRCRYTGGPVDMPKELRFTDKGVYVTWTGKLDRDASQDASNYSVSRWNYVWGKAYGSGEFSVANPDRELMKRGLTENTKGHINRDPVWVRSATLLPDRKTVFLDIPDMQVCHQMSIRTRLQTEGGANLRYEIYGTVNKTVPDSKAPTRPDVEKKEVQRPGLRPGLKVTLQTPAGRDCRVSSLAAIDYRAGEAPSALLAPRAGVNQVTFSGWLRVTELIECEIKVLRKASQVVVRLDGNPVVQLLHTVSKSSSGKLTLQPGDHELVIEVDGQSGGAAAFRLLWSVSGGPFETVPASYLFHKPDAELAEAQLIRAGRHLYATHQCASCHGTDPSSAKDAMPELALAAPDLTGIGSRLREEWLVDWIDKPHDVRPGTRMPRSVTNRQEAADIAAWLAGRSAAPNEKSTDMKTADAKHVHSGGELFHTLGCIGCHTRPDAMSYSTGRRTTLHDVARKYTPSGLASFLKDPRAHHSSSRMPNFGFDEREIESLTAWLLARSSSQPEVTRSTGDAARGEGLYESRGCAACHGQSPERRAAPELGKGLGCIDNSGSMNYGFDEDQQRALRIFVEKGYASLAIQNPEESAARLMTEYNCDACHAVGGQQDLVSRYQSETRDLLIAEQHGLDQSRPPLTWMGEAPREKHVLEALLGTRPAALRPWIHARMPSFPEPVARAIATGLPRKHAATLATKGPAKAEGAVERGAALATMADCNSCHAIGPKKATAVFEVEGVDLSLSHDRLTYDYFKRWMHNPQRYWPSTKMPPYGLDEAQMSDLWFWIQDLGGQTETKSK